MKTRIILLALSSFGFWLSSQADVLEMMNGAVLNGSYVGGTATTVRFETDSGLQVLGTDDILAITFTGESASGPISAFTRILQPHHPRRMLWRCRPGRC